MEQSSGTEQGHFASSPIINETMNSETEFMISPGQTTYSVGISNEVQKGNCGSCDSLKSSRDKISSSSSTRRSFRESVRSRFRGLGKKDNSSVKHNHCGEETQSDHCTTISGSPYSTDSLYSQDFFPELSNQLGSVSSSASSARSHRFKLWSTSAEGVNISLSDVKKPTSSRSVISDTVIYQCPPRHKVRFWLNEKRHAYSDSILEIRHSAITSRIVRARCLADVAAVEAARVAEHRRQVRALKFASAAAAAAIVRLNQATKDENASHGSIANAAMYAAKSVAAASIVDPSLNDDHNRIQNIFQQHFKHKNDPTYFRRLKYIPMKNLDRSSAAYRMHLRLKAIPSPSNKDDVYNFYTNRIDKKTSSQHGKVYQHEPIIA